MNRVARGLGWRLRALRRLLGRNAGERLAEQLAERPPQPAPEPVAEAQLDEPRHGAVVERGAFTVSGWAIFPSAATARVEVEMGGHSLGLAHLGMARPDLREQSECRDAVVAGFALATDLTAWPGGDGEATVSVVATSVTGEKLELAPRTFVLAPAPSPPARAPSRLRPAAGGGPFRRGRRAVVCTHQLCLGGASRYLLELLGDLTRRGVVDPVVLSPVDGPLRHELEALDIPVHVSGPTPLDDVESLAGRVEEVLAWAAPLEFELALVNTASPLTLCGAEVARLLGIPAVWAIHESFEPAVLWAQCDAAVRRRLEETLGGAALAIFEADATRRIYEPFLPGRCMALPYGLDLPPIDELRAGFDRNASRRDLGVPADAELVICVGTIEPRKAQASLAQAFDLISDRHPKARLALVGAGDTLDSRALSDWVESSRLADRIELVPITPDIQPWYGVADLLVCASRIESLPRAVLEGMAWELPVLATDVFGLSELIDDGSTGWLCEPGDTKALATALERSLGTDPLERRRIGAKARALVERRHDLDAYGGEVARLLEQTVMDAALNT
jgi:D-inositol-3-phosphate glycosyltransferase